MFVSGVVFTKTPAARLGNVGRPMISSPNELPWITLPVVCGPKSWIPAEPLPEITLPAPAVVPPMMLFGALLMKIPSSPLGMAPVPPALVPIKLPWIWLPVAVLMAISTPTCRLPEMRLP